MARAVVALDYAIKEPNNPANLQTAKEHIEKAITLNRGARYTFPGDPSIRVTAKAAAAIAFFLEAKTILFSTARRPNYELVEKLLRDAIDLRPNFYRALELHEEVTKAKEAPGDRNTLASRMGYYNAPPSVYAIFKDERTSHARENPPGIFRQKPWIVQAIAVAIGCVGLLFLDPIRGFDNIPTYIFFAIAGVVWFIGNTMKFENFYEHYQRDQAEQNRDDR